MPPKLSPQQEYELLLKWAEEHLNKSYDTLKKWTKHELKEELEKARVPLPPELIESSTTMTFKEVTKWVGRATGTTPKETKQSTKQSKAQTNPDANKQLSTQLVTHAQMPIIESLISAIDQLVGEREAQLQLMQKLRKDDYYDESDAEVYAQSIRESHDKLVQYGRLLDGATGKFEQFLKTRSIKDQELLDLGGGSEKLTEHLKNRAEQGHSCLGKMKETLNKLDKLLGSDM